MKCSKLLAVLGVASVLLLTANVGSADTLWFSFTATPSGAPSNPTYNATPGESFTLYLWAQMSGSMAFTGMSHDIKMSATGVVSRSGTPAASYTISNPNNGLGNRWSATGTGNTSPAAALLIDNSAMSNINGSPMGFASPASNDSTYDATSNSYLVSTLTLVASLTPGSTDLFIGVGSGGMTWKASPGGANLPAGTTINFGVGDTAIAGNDSRRSVSNANSTLADATINVVEVPEPGTLALIGLGLVGLVGLARRRKRA